MFSCKLIRQIFFLQVLLLVSSATSFAFSKEKLIKKCDEAKQEILSSTDEDKKEFIEFSKNLFITEAPQLTPSLPFSLNAPQVAPLFQKEDMQRAFDHESSQAPLLCVLKILPLIPEYSAALLPKLIDSAVLEALPREKQIAYEDSLLELSKKISQNKQNVKQETIKEIGRRLKGNSFPISLLVLKDIGTLEPIAELIKDETLVDGVLKVFSIIDTKGEKIDLLHIGASQSNVTIRKKVFSFLLSENHSEKYLILAISDPEREIRKKGISEIRVDSSESVLFEALTSKFDDVFTDTKDLISKRVANDDVLQKNVLSLLGNAEEPFVSRSLDVLSQKQCQKVIDVTPFSSLTKVISKYADDKSCNDLFSKRVQNLFSTKKISLQEKDSLTLMLRLLQLKVSLKDKEAIRKVSKSFTPEYQYAVFEKLLKQQPKDWIEFISILNFPVNIESESFKIEYTNDFGKYYQSLSQDEKGIISSMVQFSPPKKLPVQSKSLLLLFHQNGYVLTKKDLNFLSKEKYSCEEISFAYDVLSPLLKEDKLIPCQIEFLRMGVVFQPLLISNERFLDEVIASSLSLKRKTEMIHQVLTAKELPLLIKSFESIEPANKKDAVHQLQSLFDASDASLQFLTSEIKAAQDDAYIFELQSILVRLFPNDSSVKEVIGEYVQDGKEEALILLNYLPPQQAGLIITAGLQSGASIKSLLVLLRAAGQLKSAEQPLLAALKSVKEQGVTREVTFLAHKALAKLILPDQTERNLFIKEYERSRFWLEMD